MLKHVQRATQQVMLASMCCFGIQTACIGQDQQRPSAELIRKRLQELQQQATERWRRYGDVEIDWPSWRPLQNDSTVWIAEWRRYSDKPMTIGGLSWPEANSNTSRDGIPDRAIAIDCEKLMINRKRRNSDWGAWKVPQAGSAAANLVIEICSTR
jgi:hypothetical protein